jgi:DNA-binding transcriptional regulator YhcF (GntR family)
MTVTDWAECGLLKAEERYGRRVSDEYGGDGGGREFERVAAQLRARMTDGTYPQSSVLPSQRELAEKFRVSRDTIQRVLRELKSEGWIETRQGSGSRVIRTQRIHSPAAADLPDRIVTLGHLIGKAFERTDVALDVFTLTSESLDAHIRLQTELIRAGRADPPRSIALRMLLPAEDVVLPYLRPRGGPPDQRLKERFLNISRMHTASLRTALSDLRTMKLVPDVRFEVRRIEAAPLFKVYLVNETEALFGYYEPFERVIELDGGDETEAIDVYGYGAGLTHHVKGDDSSSPGTGFVERTQAWFDSTWRLLAF